MLKKTYVMADDPPSPVDWEVYSRAAAREFAELLDTTSTPERTIQEFLEKHPAFVPGAFGTGTTESGHGPVHGAMFSQPVLPGIDRRLPDFMWLSQDSMNIRPVLIEVEAPDKTWFTKEGVQRAELTQALGQLAEWRTWFNEPVNVLQFRELYRIPDNALRAKTFSPRYVLVYGRRSEFDGRPELNKKRAALQPDPDTTMMTYDRLHPHPHLDSIFTVKVANRDFNAINITPTYRLGPQGAGDLIEIADKEKAVNQSTLIGDARKAFLTARFPYWETWARDGGGGLRSSEDLE